MPQMFLPTANALVDKFGKATNSMWAWMRDITAQFNSGSGFAPADATYFLKTADASLPNGLVGTDSSTVTLDYSTPGLVKWNAVAEVPMRAVTVSLTNAEIKALPTTFKQILGAPGNGLLHIVYQVMLVISLPGVGTYTNITAGSQAGFAVAYGNWDVDLTNFYSHWDGNGFIALLNPFTSVPDAAQLVSAYPGEQNNNIGGGINLPVKLIAWNPAGNFTGGDAANFGTVTVLYNTWNYVTGALT